MLRIHTASRIASLLAAAFFVTACQPQPAMPATDLTLADPASEATATTPIATDLAPPAFAGRWFVSAAYPKGNGMANAGDPHLGASIVIDTVETNDVNGQSCVDPYLAVDRTAQGVHLGDVVLSGLERLTVTCGGHAFATYYLLPGRKLDASYRAGAGGDTPHALIAARPEAHYLLERADQVLFRQASVPPSLITVPRVVPVSTNPAAALPAAKPVAKPVELTPVAVTTDNDPTLQAPLVLAPAMPEPAAPEPAAGPKAKPAATLAEATLSSNLPAAGTAIHLASYSGFSAAKRGWKTLLGEFDALDPLSPLYVEIDVPEKGRMIRLYATGADAAGLTAACAALTAKGAYCQMAR